MAARVFLTITTETTAKRIPVEPGADGETFVIGRTSTADLFLNDSSISRRHCSITPTEEGGTLEDLGSSSGTFRNGVRIADPIALEDGDEIQVAGVVLLVVFEADEALPKKVRAKKKVTPKHKQPASAEAVADKSARPLMPRPAPPPAPPPEDRTVVVAPGGRVATRSVDLVVPLLGRERFVIGRVRECDVTLDNPTISRQHAEITKHGTTFGIRDLGSSNGTYVNGSPLTQPAALNPGDTIKIGPYNLTFDGVGLSSRRPEEGTRIEVRAIGKQVNDRETGKPIWLLKNIYLTVKPKEFVGLLGASGCGKSTFMDAVNGRRPATTGAVLYNEENLYNRFDAFKRGIGYVPQELIFHEALPVADALRYASRLRLPDDVTSQEVEANIDRVLGIVGLTERRDTLIRHLSGGQKKRVSIAMELLSKPTLLFLDEATSGLDLGTEAQMMKLFRELADSGVTTMCITHYVDSLDICDTVAYFVSGRLAFYGPPKDLKEYFGVTAIREVYVKESEKTAEEWETAFRYSQAYREHVVGRAAPAENHEKTMVRPGQAIRSDQANHPFIQWKTLTRRYVQTILGDRRETALALSLAPIIAILVSMVLSGDSSDFHSRDPAIFGAFCRRQGQLSFILTLVMIFLGVFGAIREVVKELEIYRHERFVNLEILPYLGSKILPLSVLGAIQAFEMLLIVHMFTDIHGNFIGQFLVLFLTTFAAMLLGLALSAAVNTADKAVRLMILAIIPQLLFANAFIELKGGFSKVFAWLTILGYWCHDGLKSLMPDRVMALQFDTKNYALDLLMILLFAAIYAGAAYCFMRRKDGPYGKPFQIPWVKGLTRK